jgi:hypothetical protein
MTDEMKYTREDGRNVLKLFFRIKSGSSEAASG